MKKKRKREIKKKASIGWEESSEVAGPRPAVIRRDADKGVRPYDAQLDSCRVADNASGRARDDGVGGARLKVEETRAY